MAFFRRPPTGYKPPSDAIEDLFTDLSIAGTKAAKHSISNHTLVQNKNSSEKKKNFFNLDHIRKKVETDGNRIKCEERFSDSLADVITEDSNQCFITESACQSSTSESIHNELPTQDNGIYVDEEKSVLSESSTTGSKSHTTGQKQSTVVKVKDVLFELNSAAQTQKNQNASASSSENLTQTAEIDDTGSDKLDRSSCELKSPTHKKRPASASARLGSSTDLKTSHTNINKLAQRRQRISSAKAKLCENKEISNNVQTPSTKPAKTQKARPQSAHVFRTRCEDNSAQKENTNSLHPRRKERPQSAHNLGRPPPECDLDEDKDNTLKPSIYGLKHSRHVFGSNLSIDSVPSDEFSLYKFSCSPKIEHPKRGGIHAQKPIQKLNNSPKLPSCLEILRPWLTCNLSDTFTGVEASNCLIFLPSLKHHTVDLPVVPPPPDPFQELPYMEKVTIPEEPKKPKKYKHYAGIQPVDGWVCNHTSRESAAECSPNSHSLYRNYDRKRTADVIRQEIIELEKLMQGIGTIDGSSIIVRYQAEITNLQREVMSTLAGVDDSVWDRLRESDGLPHDYFGFRAFSQEHDKLMDEIRRQHRACVRELAELERQIISDDSQRYFSSDRK